MIPVRAMFAVVFVIFAGLISLGCVTEPVSNPLITTSPTVMTTVSSTPPITPYPTLPTTRPHSISTNWAGYVVETDFSSPQNGAIEAVEAIWNIPTVDCSSTGSSEYSSSFWVGIDGYASGSIEQIGTDSDCIQGSPVYYAWYEMYPRDSVTLDLTLSPGDLVHAKVSYQGNQEFLLSLVDMTTGQNVSISETSTVAMRNSAEWIAEAPVYRQKILPLSDFGPVDFLNVSVTVNGRKGTLQHDQWAYKPIFMETSDRIIKAIPSELVNGDRFSVVWEHA